MKHLIIILFLLILLFSCKTTEIQSNKVYKQTFPPSQKISILKLKKNHKFKDLQFFSISQNKYRLYGKWELHNDTLVLYYKKGYGLEDKNTGRKLLINEDFTKIYLLDGREFYVEDK